MQNIYMMPFAKRVGARAITHGVRATARAFSVSHGAVHQWRSRYVGYDRRCKAWTIEQHIRRFMHQRNGATLREICDGINRTNLALVATALQRSVQRGAMQRSGTRRNYWYQLKEQQ